MKHMKLRAVVALFTVALLLLPAAAETSARTEEPEVHGFSFTPSEKYPYSAIRKKILSYQKTNPDVKGWLRIPGTDINEPILFDQREDAADNDYYVNRTWDGKAYKNLNYKNYVNTASYLDFRTHLGENWSKTSRNSTIYGHNWTNLRHPLDIGPNPKHQMFAQLPSFTDENFVKQNPYIYYSTENMEGIWKVFAVAYCEDDPSFFYVNPNPKRNSYQKLLDEWRERSLFNFDVEVLTTDRILTLSTCTRWYPDAHEQQRFVVVARLLRDGESENDPVKFVKNPNPKQPIFQKAPASAASSSAPAA